MPKRQSELIVVKDLLDLPEGQDRIELPLDCEAEYFPGFLTPQESTEIFDFLTENYDLSDRPIPSPTGPARTGNGKYMFADPELTGFDHLPEVLGLRAAWPPLLEQVRERLESVLSRRFQVCLCIRYPNGESGAGFHVDMSEFGSVSFLTVISLGAEREFAFRPLADRENETRLVLKRGSLLTMGERCQERYEHGVPPDSSCKSPRISLSYRYFGWP